MLNKTVAVEAQFFGPITVWALAVISGKMLIEAHDNYQKRSFRNKCVLASSDGAHTFTVPLKKGKHQQKVFRHVRISYDTPWQSLFSKTIETNYGSSPYFEHYIDQIKTIVHSQHEYIFDLNLEIIRWIESSFHLNIDISLSEEYIFNYNEYIIDLRDALNTRNYTKRDYAPPYYQVFEDQQEHLLNASVLDAIFNTGPELKSTLKEIGTKL